MDENNTQYKRVVAYVRKSSEDNVKGVAHKQHNSVDYQRNFIKETIKRDGLKQVQPNFEDDKTGYEAFVREGFENMINYLRDHRDEVDGIVCTEISRLARNFGDGGMILWYMQSGIIKRIYTHSKTFTNSSTDQMMVAIEFAMSKKSSDDTGDRTILGMRSKVRTMGHPARRPILGYVSQGPVGTKKWVIDPKNGPLIQKVFGQFSTGKYDLRSISDYAYSIGLRSIDNNSTTGKFGHNTWRNRLMDAQYTGVFEHEGERISGKYDPLISNSLFYEVQRILNKNQHPKSTHIDYAYSGLIPCPFCGRNLTGMHKKGITYYRCDKRKAPCSTTKRGTYVLESNLEKDLMNTFENLEIDQETWKEARAYLEEVNEPEKIKFKQEERRLSELVAKEAQLQIDLGRKFAQGEIDNKYDYGKLMGHSREQETTLRSSLIRVSNYLDELNRLMDDFLEKVKYVTKRLKIATPTNKKEIIQIFCENFRIEDKKLRWDWKKPYFLFAKQPKSSTLLPRLDSNQRHPR